MTTLYHYTCDHGAAGIARDGWVSPLSDRVESPYPQADFAWFTDLDTPIREALGLTSHILSCDRTAHRFKVTDATEVARYLDVRRNLPSLHDLELAPGAMPAHWWIASEPVPVVAA